MNVRDYKLSAPGQFFHVYNRGNAKETIFLSADDFRFFLLRLRQNLIPDSDTKMRLRPLPAGAFDLVSYCLMPNHFHLLIKQNGDVTTGKLIAKLCTSYGRYFNKKYERVGHIFQDQFKQIHVDSNKYLAWLSAYIHNNPVAAGLVKKPGDWPWSSYTEHMQYDGKFDLVKPEIVTEQYKNKADYEDFTKSALSSVQEQVGDYLLLDAEH